MTAENKIKKFHADEVVLILLICSTDMESYSNDDLVDFTEDIEGRVDVLFEPDFLVGLNDYIEITSDAIRLLEILRVKLMDLYSPSWHLKMKDKKIWSEINSIGNSIIELVKIELVEPNKFKDSPGILELE